MAHTGIEKAFKEIVVHVAERLAPLGFKRTGKEMRIVRDGNCGIVEFQRSTKSSKSSILFTINIGIVCGALVDSLANANVLDAHVRQRVGMLLPSRPDKWWEVNDAIDTRVVVEEVARIAVEKIVPFIESLLSTEAIISLWESGQSPGLTAVQRANLLATLKKRKYDDIRDVDRNMDR